LKVSSAVLAIIIAPIEIEERWHKSERYISLNSFRSNQGGPGEPGPYKFGILSRTP
jgi:hypothetical protein